MRRNATIVGRIRPCFLKEGPDSETPLKDRIPPVPESHNEDSTKSGLSASSHSASTLFPSLLRALLQWSSQWPSTGIEIRPAVVEETPPLLWQQAILDCDFSPLTLSDPWCSLDRLVVQTASPELEALPCLHLIHLTQATLPSLQILKCNRGCSFMA